MVKHVTESSLAIVGIDGYSSLADAITAIGSNNRTITISKEITISTETTVPSNIVLQIQNGGTLNVSSILTCNGPIQAGRYQIFDGYGTININPISTPEIHTSWFGFSPSITNPAWNTTYLTRALVALDSYGTLIVDPGNYDVFGQSVKNVAKTDIKIIGYGASIEQTKNISGIFVLSNHTRLRIEGLRLIGLGSDFTQSTTAANGIILNTCNFLILKNLDLLNFGFAGINLSTNTANVLIEDCYIEGTGRRLGNINLGNNYQFCIYVNGSGQTGYFRVSRCELCWAAFGAFIDGRWDNVDFSGNNVHDMPGQHGLYMVHPRNMTVANNTVRNIAGGNAGMKLQLTDTKLHWCDNITITGNTVTNTGYAILLITAAAVINYNFKNVTISGNAVQGANFDGIYCREGLGVNIVGNTISNCGNLGIRAEGNLITVNSNLISHTGNAGMLVDIGNYLEEWSGIGTYTQGQIVLASDDILYECQADGGEIQDPTTDILDAYWSQLNNFDMTSISNNTVIDPFYATEVSSYGIFVTAKKTNSAAFIHDNIIQDGYNQIDWAIYVGQKLNSYIYNNYSSPGCGTIRLLAPEKLQMAYNNTAKFYGTPITGFGKGTGYGRTYFSDAAPDSDGYIRGDIMWNIAPSSGSNVGWLCTTSGTPGTWKPFGLTSIPEIAPLDGYAMTWNSSSSLWEYETKVTRRIATIGSPASPGGLREVTGFSGVDTIEVAGFWAAGDGGGGSFVWDSASVEADDYGTIIRPLSIAPGSPGRWKRVFDNSEVDVKWFGAIGDGIVDDYGSINWAIASRASYGGTVRFSRPPLVYRVTGSIVVGTKFVPEIDAIEGVYTAGSGDLYLEARAMKHVNLKGDEGAAIWGDFDADGYQAIIYYSIPYGYPYKVNSEISVIEGLVVHGKPSFTPGSPPVIVATQDPAAADAYQVGICVPWVSANTIKNCVARYCAVGHLYSQNYWSRNEHNTALCCHEGFCIRQANASSTNDCKALFCDRGFVVSGQTFSVYGIHTEQCGTDLWIKKVTREFAIRSCYFENSACHRDSYSIMIGDPNDAEETQVSSGTFENMHFGRTVIGGEGGGSGYLILTNESSGFQFRMAQMGLTAPTTWNALHLNYCAIFYHDASPTVNANGYNGNGVIHLRTTSQAFNLTQGRMFINNDFEFLDEDSGVILKSPGGSRFRITIGDDGYLVSTFLS